MVFAILIVKHVNLLLNASGFAFSGVLLCCVSSVVMRIDNDTLYYSNNINYDQLLSLTNYLMKEKLLMELLQLPMKTLYPADPSPSLAVEGVVGLYLLFVCPSLVVAVVVWF